MPAASLHALLAQSIDYAGLFPPCSLELEPALRNQASYTRNEDAWMLGSFVLPIAKFEEAKNYLSQFDQKHPLRISALGAKTESASAFRETLTDYMQTMRELVKSRGAILSITQLEMPLPTDVDAALLADTRSILEGLPTFLEAPADAAERTIALLAENDSDKTLGFKLRTGGVTAGRVSQFGANCARAHRSRETSCSNQIYRWFAPPGANVPLRSGNEDARISERSRRRCSRGRARLGRATNLSHARGRRCDIIFLLR